MLRITETQFDKLSGWRPQPMTMPLEAVPHCPCCLGRIEPVAGLYTPLAIVTVAACSACGWLGYGNRPSAEWFESFYASDWDEAGQAAQIDLLQHGLHPMAAFVSKIASPGVHTVCDIGCGFGSALWQLQRAGYSVCGVEKSKHRAVVAKVNGLWVESDLSAFGKLDVIASHHVLEHSVDPDAFVREIAEHQDEGGIMYLSVPNQIGEPSMGCLLFLPHLHSFTVQSLCALALRHGYLPHAMQNCGFNLQISFKKRSNKLNFESAALPCVVDKLSRAVHANGQGDLLSWCGNLSDTWFTTADRFSEWSQNKWKPRALAAKRDRCKGRFPVEVETPCLFVK